MAKKKAFLEAFKVRAVREVLDSHRKIPDLAKELGTSASTLRAWVRTYSHVIQATEVSEDQTQGENQSVKPETVPHGEFSSAKKGTGGKGKSPTGSPKVERNKKAATEASKKGASVKQKKSSKSNKSSKAFKVKEPPTSDFTFKKKII